MPELWGRPTWQIDTDPEPSFSPRLFWITVSVVIGAAAGYVLWKLFR